MHKSTQQCDNHSRPHLLGLTDRHYCEKLLLTILRGSLATRRQWLMRVRLARADYVKDHQIPTKITGYFINYAGLQSSQALDPVRAPPKHLNTKITSLDLITTQGNKPQTRTPFHSQERLPSRQQQLTRRHVKAQSLITRFFPSARPPDLAINWDHDLCTQIPCTC